MTASPPDEFVSRFGQLSPGPRHPNNEKDQSIALYDPDTGARRFTFENEPGNAWAIDAKTGERAFRIDAKGNTFLPNGKPLGKAPKATPRVIPTDPGAKLYGKPKARTLVGGTLLSKPAKPQPVLRGDEARFAQALCGKGR